MKIGVNIQNVNGRYNAQIDTLSFTATEEEKMAEFGEPAIELGGDLSGSVSRPGQNNTTLAFTGGGGSGATGVPVIDQNGAITGVTITAPGSGYASAPTVVVTGDGQGANLTAVISGGALASVTVVSGGYGYHVTPVAVSLSIATSQRRIRSDFPVKQVFDLADDPTADCLAKLWSDTIVARVQAAKVVLMAQQSPLEGETVTTI